MDPEICHGSALGSPVIRMSHGFRSGGVGLSSAHFRVGKTMAAAMDNFIRQHELGRPMCAEFMTGRSGCVKPHRDWTHVRSRSLRTDLVADSSSGEAPLSFRTVLFDASPTVGDALVASQGRLSAMAPDMPRSMNARKLCSNVFSENCSACALMTPGSNPR